MVNDHLYVFNIYMDTYFIKDIQDIICGYAGNTKFDICINELKIVHYKIEKIIVEGMEDGSIKIKTKKEQSFPEFRIHLNGKEIPANRLIYNCFS